MPLNAVDVKSFADGEISIKIQESVRGKDVYVLQSICRSGDGKMSVNDSLVELYLMIAAFRRHSAGPTPDI